MRRLLLPVAAALLTIAGTGLATTRPATTRHKFTERDTLAVIRTHGSTATYAGEIRNSVVGKAAELSTSTLSGSSGHSQAVGYHGDGTTKATSTFQLGPQRPNGDIPVTLKGKFTGGTGRYRHLTGTYSGSGVVKANSGIVILQLHGTGRF